MAVRLGATAGSSWTDVGRTIAFADFSQSESSHYTARHAGVRGNSATKLGSALAFLEPVAGGAAVRVNQDGFSETAGAASVVGSGRGYDVQTVTAGLRAESLLPFATAPVTARAFLGYRHAFGDVNPKALLAFQAGSSTFTTEGAPIDRDALVTELGLDYHVVQAWTLGVSYTGQYGARTDSSALRGRAEYRF